MCKYRSALARLRCSAHRLNLEVSRYESILMENRICELCDRMNMCVIEDEYHFVLQCPSYVELRASYIDQYFHVNPSYAKFIELLCTTNESYLRKLAIYVYLAMRLRESLSTTYAKFIISSSLHILVIFFE
jgi:hypothetical protein